MLLLFSRKAKKMSASPSKLVTCTGEHLKERLSFEGASFSLLTTEKAQKSGLTGHTVSDY